MWRFAKSPDLKSFAKCQIPSEGAAKADRSNVKVKAAEGWFGLPVILWDEKWSLAEQPRE